MKLTVKLSAALLVTLCASLPGGVAGAQPLLLPADQFNAVDLRVPQSTTLMLEKLNGQKDFEPIARFKSSARFRRLARPVGRLKVLVADESGRTGVSLCTASIISSDYILTNHHCIPGAVGRRVIDARIEMQYLRMGSRSVRSFRVDTRPTEASQPLDYSVVRVHGNPASTFGHIAIDPRGASARDSVFIIHHPAGQPKTLSRKDCTVLGLRNGTELIHTCDTLGGSSGAPVFSDESFQVVGLHFAGTERENYAKNMRVLASVSRYLKPGAAVKPRPAPRPVVAPSSRGGPQKAYRRLVRAHRNHDAETYFRSFADPMDCFWGRAAKTRESLRRSRGSHFSKRWSDWLEIVSIRGTELGPGRVQLRIDERWHKANKTPSYIKFVVMQRGQSDGVWRATVEQGKRATRCYRPR